jgi:hypothetical protein
MEDMVEERIDHVQLLWPILSILVEGVVLQRYSPMEDRRERFVMSGKNKYGIQLLSRFLLRPIKFELQQHVSCIARYTSEKANLGGDTRSTSQVVNHRVQARSIQPRWYGSKRGAVYCTHCAVDTHVMGEIRV